MNYNQSHKPKRAQNTKATNRLTTRKTTKAINLCILKPSNIKALRKLYKLKSVDPVVWTEINRLFEKVCEKIFSKKKINKEFTIKDVDDQIIFANNEISSLFVKHGEMITLQYLKHKVTTITVYHPNLQNDLEQAYGVTFESKYVVHYIAGGLSMLFADIVSLFCNAWNIKYTYEVIHLTMDKLLLAVNDDFELNQFFDHIAFQFTNALVN
jgi:hypothetical protein